MVLAIVHPDYMLSELRLKQYEEFLCYLKSRAGAWFALPRDVARWWRTRAAATLVSNGCDVGLHCDAENVAVSPLFAIQTVSAGAKPGELIPLTLAAAN
jgi:hypothetical protein